MSNQAQPTPPEGYRYVYGQLERIPAPVTEPAEWEALPAHGTDAEAKRRFPHAKKWEPVSPDGFPIDAAGKTYRKASDAVRALVTWCQQFKGQGGYRSGRGYFIEYADIFDECDILPS